SSERRDDRHARIRPMIKRMFTNRWVLGALMVIALDLAIWFVGPAVAIFDVRPLDGWVTRLVIVLAIAALWLGCEVWRVPAAGGANRKLLEGIAGGGDPGEAKAAQEVEVLRQRFEEAAATLKKARFAGGVSGEKQYLYQLPWYVFIGASGSGKTTALI